MQFQCGHDVRSQARQGSAVHQCACAAPAGDQVEGCVGPYHVYVGTPSAAATCFGPESVPTTAPSRAMTAASAPTPHAGSSRIAGA